MREGPLEWCMYLSTTLAMCGRVAVCSHVLGFEQRQGSHTIVADKEGVLSPP
jgi:hypothetical protein